MRNWGNDTDSTPVFYSSKKLHVTGMKVSTQSSVYPVSAVAKVETTRRSPAFLEDVFRVCAAGVLIIVGCGVFVRAVPGLPPSLMKMLVLLVILGAVLVMAAGLGLYLLLFERFLQVHLMSGTTIKISVYSAREVLEMKAALERALTYSINQATQPASAADELAKFAALKDSGALSESEWQRAKDMFLGKEHDAQDRAVIQLRQLHELHKSGVLSESEFNMKKWDVLARQQA